MTTASHQRIRPLEIVLAPLRWLERSRGWRRRLLMFAYLCVGVVIGFFVWWATSLNDLPDVGDPFDVEAFVKSSRMPDSENAFSLYGKAVERFHDEPVVTQNWNLMWTSIRGGWAKTDPQTRSWVAANREALDLWREGTTRTDGIAEDLTRIHAYQDNNQNPIVSLTFAAIFEGCRLESEGDRAAAMDWYLAVGRACRHYSTKSRLEWRSLANSLESPMRDRIVAMALDPKTDATLLKRAIASIQDLDARIPPIGDNLKVNYLALMHSLEDLPKLTRALDHIGNSTYPYSEWRRGHRVFWFVKREPDRSRRIVRLFFANWLAFCELPTAARPKMIGNAETYPIWGYYQASPGDPPAARAIEPTKLFAWLGSTTSLWRFLTTYPAYMPQIATEKQAHATLMVILAEQAYLRENGKESPSVGALVPKYLKVVPPEYAGMEPKPQ